MRDLIRSLKFTKEHKLSEIEQTLIDVPRYGSDYYSIKKLNCDSIVDAASEIYIYLQSNLKEMKELVRSIFGDEAAEDEDIVRLYMDVNKSVIEDYYIEKLKYIRDSVMFYSDHSSTTMLYRKLNEIISNYHDEN